MDRPALRAGLCAQVGIGVDGGRMADQFQHGDVVGRVAVGGTPRQVQALPHGERPDRLRLRGAVQQPADQPPGVLAVH